MKGWGHCHHQRWMPFSTVPTLGPSGRLLFLVTCTVSTVVAPMVYCVLAPAQRDGEPASPLPHHPCPDCVGRPLWGPHGIHVFCQQQSLVNLKAWSGGGGSQHQWEVGDHGGQDRGQRTSGGLDGRVCGVRTLPLVMSDCRRSPSRLHWGPVPPPAILGSDGTSRLAPPMGNKPLDCIMGKRKFPKRNGGAMRKGRMDSGQLYSALKHLRGIMWLKFHH